MKIVILLCTVFCVYSTLADERPALSAKKVLDYTINKIRTSEVGQDYYQCLNDDLTVVSLYDNFSTVTIEGKISFYDFKDITVVEFAQMFENSLPLGCGFNAIASMGRKNIRQVLSANNRDLLGSLNWDK